MDWQNRRFHEQLCKIRIPNAFGIVDMSIAELKYVVVATENEEKTRTPNQMFRHLQRSKS